MLYYLPRIFVSLYTPPFPQNISLQENIFLQFDSSNDTWAGTGFMLLLRFEDFGARLCKGGELLFFSPNPSLVLLTSSSCWKSRRASTSTPNPRTGESMGYKIRLACSSRMFCQATKSRVTSIAQGKSDVRHRKVAKCVKRNRRKSLCPGTRGIQKPDGSRFSFIIVCPRACKETSSISAFPGLIVYIVSEPLFRRSMLPKVSNIRSRIYINNKYIIKFPIHQETP